VGARYFAHVQAGPGAHPASCTMCTGSFPGVKWPERGIVHPPLLAPRSRMSRAIPLLPSGPPGPVIGRNLLHFLCFFMLSNPLCIIISYKSINQNSRPTQLFIKQIYNICGSDMFRLFSVSHPQALHNFLNHNLKKCYS
jgi:hypothetical protein